MKRIIVFIIVLVAAAALAAAEPDKENGPDEPAENVRTAPVSEDGKQPEQQTGGSWPRPFVPSEKISADSVVSFPADI